MNNKVIQGVIHGSTIELSENPGFSEGQAVEVVVAPLVPPRTWGDGIRNAAGGLAALWTEEDDEILVEIHRDRKRESGREALE
jgi:hypothetical protein